MLSSLIGSEYLNTSNSKHGFGFKAGESALGCAPNLRPQHHHRPICPAHPGVRVRRRLVLTAKPSSETKSILSSRPVFREPTTTLSLSKKKKMKKRFTTKVQRL
ncbi:unnamed protein product [Camellia sinensis]